MRIPAHRQADMGRRESRSYATRVEEQTLSVVMSTHWANVILDQYNTVRDTVD
ncbi:hypothetical protein [Streptomyces sp. R08]|uniref:Uncharacterized protein n=1 Tax=Streptomyces sp. R08 TaxID=3238624 RepID=A0AB39MNV7_9ACTN